MQEEVENRTLTLVVSGTKFTGRLFKAAITKYLAHRKEKKLQKQKSRDTVWTVSSAESRRNCLTCCSRITRTLNCSAGRKAAGKLQKPMKKP